MEDIRPALKTIVRSEEAVFTALWAGLSAAQQNLLRAIAADSERLYSAETLRRFGLSSTAAAARAVSALEGRGIVIKAEGKVVFDNPFLRAWVERELVPDTPRL